jgi:very-short-patch-repair endonuclease
LLKGLKSNFVLFSSPLRGEVRMRVKKIIDFPSLYLSPKGREVIQEFEYYLREHNSRVGLARELRRKQTDAENLLWAGLRNLRSDGIKYRRQHPIGDYIVDFVCLEKKLIIEVDGGQHNEDREIKRDGNRTKWLENEGYRVIRLWNNDVLENLEGVIFRIREALE